jgi:photosystem II stability/assembly factor-like uncharacterized protein
VRLSLLAFLATLVTSGCSLDDPFSAIESVRDAGALDLAPDLAEAHAPLSWAAQTSGTGSSLYGVWGASRSDIWAVGLMSTILHSSDGGMTFGQVTSATFSGDWYSVGGSSANDLFIVSTTGTAIHSGDGGVSWTDVSTPSRSAMAILGFPSGDVFILGTTGLAHTIDGGTTWNTITPATGGEMMTGIWGTSINDLYIAGSSGLILHTSNGGATWSSKIGPNAFLRGIGGTSNGSDVYIVGDSNCVLHSNDHGATWTLQTSPLSPLTSFMSVTAPSADDIIAVGTTGAAMLAAIASSDNGVTWTEANLGTSYGLHALWAAGPQDVFAVGEHGTILHGR